MQVLRRPGLYRPLASLIRTSCAPFLDLQSPATMNSDSTDSALASPKFIQAHVFASVAALWRCMQSLVILPHVQSAISSLLYIHPKWTLERASLAGYPRLMKILLARERLRCTDASVVFHLCNRGLDAAAAAG